MSAAAVPLLERDDELASLSTAIDDGRRGDGRLVVIEGPAGIGKTALLRRVRERAAAEGLLALTARGAELEREFAFGAVRQLLERAAQAGPRELFDGPAGLAAPLLGAGAPTSGLHAPTTVEASYAVVHGLFWLTVNLARRGPVALLVDDVQWLDASSLRFLAYLAARLDGLGALVVLAARTGEPGAEPLPAELTLAEHAVVLRPRPLSAPAAQRLVHAALPDADPELCAACHAAAAGNPLFLRELIGALRDAGPRRSLDVLERAPDGVRAAVAARAARLPAAARALAQAVAVLGTDVLLRHAAAVAGLDAAAAAVAADELADADLLQRGRPLRFVHPIVRAAVLDALPPAALSAAHAGAARLLSADHTPTERVAAHLLAVDPDAEPWVCTVLASAARDALARGAPEAAVTYLRRVLLEPPPEAERPGILLELGHAEALAFQVGPAIEHLGAGIAANPDPTARLRAALTIGPLLGSAGTMAEAVAFMDEALDHADGADAAVVAELEGRLVNFARSDPHARRRVATRIASILARVSVDGSTAPASLAALAADRAMAADPAERVVELARRALAIPVDVSRNPGDLTAAMAGRCLIMADQLEEAEAELEAVVDALTERGAGLLAVPQRVFLTEALRRRGRLADAERVGREALADARQGWSLGVSAALAVLAETLVDRDRAQDAAALLDEHGITGSAAALDGVYTTTMVLHARGTTRLALGDLRGATDDLLTCGARLDGIDEVNPAALCWRSLAARALHARGEDREARLLAAEELALARRFGAPRAISIALRAVAAVGPEAEALDALLEAAAITSDSPAVLEHAEALAALGAAQIAAGEPQAASASLEAALDLARRCEAAGLVRRTAAALTGLGRRAPRRPTVGPAALTPAERRVADLAARGLSNQEIADRLVITLRTVEYHLTRAYRKLDIASRRELAGALAGSEPAAPGRAG